MLQLESMWARAGWGIWPTCVFGLIALGLGIHYALAPRSHTLPLVLGFSVASVLASFIAVITGMETPAWLNRGPHAPGALLTLVVIEIAETVPAVELAFALLIGTTLAIATGRFRLNRARG